MIQEIAGNILEVESGIICHQVNCKGVMGAGLAKEIAIKYPIVLTQYKDYCKRSNSDKNLLGKVLISPISYDLNYNPILVVANIFGQFSYGTDKVQTDYEALKTGFKQILHISESFNLNVYIPYKIGCGLAGGDWATVKSILLEIFSNTKSKCFIIKYN